MNEFECEHCGRVYDDATDCGSDDCPGNETSETPE
jgi:hypothetical protein